MTALIESLARDVAEALTTADPRSRALGELALFSARAAVGTASVDELPSDPLIALMRHYAELGAKARSEWRPVLDALVQRDPKNARLVALASWATPARRTTLFSLLDTLVRAEALRLLVPWRVLSLGEALDALDGLPVGYLRDNTALLIVQSWPGEAAVELTELTATIGDPSLRMSALCELIVADPADREQVFRWQAQGEEALAQSPDELASTWRAVWTSRVGAAEIAPHVQRSSARLRQDENIDQRRRRYDLLLAAAVHGPLSLMTEIIDTSLRDGVLFRSPRARFDVLYRAASLTRWMDAGRALRVHSHLLSLLPKVTHGGVAIEIVAKLADVSMTRSLRPPDAMLSTLASRLARPEPSPTGDLPCSVANVTQRLLRHDVASVTEHVVFAVRGVPDPVARLHGLATALDVLTSNALR